MFMKNVLSSEIGCGGTVVKNEVIECGKKGLNLNLCKGLYEVAYCTCLAICKECEPKDVPGSEKAVRETYKLFLRKVFGLPFGFYASKAAGQALLPSTSFFNDFDHHHSGGCGGHPPAFSEL
ncbi:hypothetical protein TYRP_016725 [Tyrophagus putrescentiae]|nr:hypothetical protein TYRP_016725 [Tyrophagus putrescentiae]